MYNKNQNINNIGDISSRMDSFKAVSEIDLAKLPDTISEINDYNLIMIIAFLNFNLMIHQLDF